MLSVLGAVCTNGYDDSGYPCSNSPGVLSTIGSHLLPVLLVLFILFVASRGFRIIQQYEMGVVFRFGKVVREIGAGINFVIPFIDKVERVNVQIQALALKPQEVITRDSVSLTITAVIYYRVNQPTKAVVGVDDYNSAIKQRGQAIMRGVIGGKDLSDILGHSEAVATQIKTSIEPVAEQWGLEVSDISLKDVKLPENMQRAMAAIAEAGREAEAKVISADGEKAAAESLAEAARILGTDGLRLVQLRVIREVGTEQSTIIVIDSNGENVTGKAAAGAIAGGRQDN